MHNQFSIVTLAAAFLILGVAIAGAQSGGGPGGTGDRAPIAGENGSH